MSCDQVSARIVFARAATVVVATLLAPMASGQTIRTWSTATSDTSWTTAANWVGGVFAGVGASPLPGEGSTTDVAFRGSNSGTSLGIDMAAVGGTLTLAAMDLDPGTTTLAIGNESTTAAGILQLNGAVTFGTTTPIANSILRANNATTTSSATTTIQAAVGAGTQPLGLRLGTANGAVITAGSKTLALNVPLSEVNAGSGFRKLGTGVLILGAPGTLSGGTLSFEAGTMRITNPDALGGAAGPVIQFNPGGVTATLGVGFNGELTNAIEIPAGLSQQQLIQTSAAGTPTLAGVMAVNFNTQIRHNQSSGNLTVSGTANRVGSGATVSFTTQTAGSVTDSAVWSGAGILAYSSSGTAATGSFFISGQKTHTGGSRINSMTGDAVVSGDSQGPANAPTSGPFGTGAVQLAARSSLRSGTAADVIVGNPVTLLSTSTAARFPTTNDEKSLTFTGDVNHGSANRTLQVDVGSRVAGKYVALNGSMSGAGTLTKTGSGTLVLGGSNSYAGSLIVQAGRLQLANAAAAAAATVTPLAGGTLTLAASAATTLGGLAPNAGGLTDVGNGFVTVAAGLSAADLLVGLTAGRAGGTWTGTSGIVSSAAAAAVAAGAPRTVGWLDNADGSVTFAYAAPGDTNLDWSIDILDASNFLAAAKFDTGLPATWAEGDFGYDGIVDILDAADLFATGLYDAGGYNASERIGGIAAVPEPAVGIVAVGLAAMLLIRTRGGKPWTSATETRVSSSGPLRSSNSSS
jgi:autotransporter-associated beta strand protein